MRSETVIRRALKVEGVKMRKRVGFGVDVTRPPGHRIFSDENAGDA